MGKHLTGFEESAIAVNRHDETIVETRTDVLGSNSPIRPLTSHSAATETVKVLIASLPTHS